MTEEQNKEIVRRFWEEAVNEGNLLVIEECIADDWVNYTPSLYGHDGAKEFVSIIHTALPDVECAIDDIIAEGDKVAYRFTLFTPYQDDMIGTDEEEEFDVIGIGFARVADGKIVEHWVSLDAGEAFTDFDEDYDDYEDYEAF